MSLRGVTLHTRAASAAERRRRARTSPSLAIRTCVSASCVWASATGLCSPVSNSDCECCWSRNHVSMRWTDIETWLLARGPYRRPLDLSVRHLDRGVIPGEPRAVELRPEASDLDADGSLHLRRLHGGKHGRVPALCGVARRLDEANDDGSGECDFRTTSGHSYRECRSVAWVRRRRSSPRCAIRSVEAPRARGTG